MQDEVLEHVTRFYLEAADFKGMPLATLRSILGSDVVPAVAALVQMDRAEVLGASHDINTHIKRFGVGKKERQLEALERDDPQHTCIYPSGAHLASAVDRSLYDGKPYALDLALDAAQLSYRSFDLAVLETYRNDPRYNFKSAGVGGQLCVSDAYYESEHMLPRDQVLLETFGFSVNGEYGRAVAVFVCYLARLSPEHQQLWKARELDGHFRLHPIYFKNSILGEWHDEIPILYAFLMELALINEMAAAMGRPQLFRDTPVGPEELKGFDFLLRPTQAEFDAFVVLLDKLLSDNLNKAFFGTDISDEAEEERADGKIVVRPKGTIQMLDEWFRLKFRSNNCSPWEATIGTLKNVRKLRQKPAHAIRADAFDHKFSAEQRQLIVSVYDAVRTIRLCLANHPNVRRKNIEINPALFEGKICDF